jgi:hypothetical protein
MKPSRAERKEFERNSRNVKYLDLLKSPRRYENTQVTMFGSIRWIEEQDDGTTQLVFNGAETHLIGPLNEGDFHVILQGYTPHVTGDWVRVQGWLAGRKHEGLPVLNAKWLYKP